MPRFVLIAMNGVKPGGDEQDLERWYRDVHIPDLKSAGFTCARRYRTLRGDAAGAEVWPYVAIYEVEADDIATVMGELGTKLRPFHPDFDHARSAHILAVQISGDD